MMDRAADNGIVVVDFGLGNMRSLEKALEHLGYPGKTTSDVDEILAAEKVILPGDGAFGAAMENLNERDASGRTLAQAVLDVVKRGTPLFGICVGMQALFDWGEEFGRHEGLRVIPGAVLRFPEDRGVKIPQIGWNNVYFEQKDCALFQGLESGSRVYFIHSYYCAPEDPAVVAAATEHGIRYCSILHHKNVYATQFHPEKSGEVGLKILENFCRLGN
jgi:glutamine amidotransferase